MAWTGIVRLDADKDEVGVATAIWNEGQPDEFQYTRRAKVSGVEAARFIAEAQEALDAAVAKAARNEALSATLTNLLNE